MVNNGVIARGEQTILREHLHILSRLLCLYLIAVVAVMFLSPSTKTQLQQKPALHILMLQVSSIKTILNLLVQVQVLRQSNM